MADGWWNDGGNISGCQVAYRAIGAASLAASYVNLFNSGTNDAAPGEAPTFATATGWTFNGTDQYLTTGLTPTCGAGSMLIRYTDLATTDGKVVAGSYVDSGGDAAFLVQVAGTTMRTFNGTNAANADNSPHFPAGVYGFAGKTPYRDAVAEGNVIGAGTGTSPTALFIGALSYTGATPLLFSSVKIQAIVVYSTTLSSGEVSTLTAAMAALTAGGSPVAKILQMHGAYLGAELA